jgi:hypothetical protein
LAVRKPLPEAMIDRTNKMTRKLNLFSLAWIASMLFGCMTGCQRSAELTNRNTAQTGSAQSSPVPGTNSGTGLKLLPVDEAPNDPSFLVFRKELITAIERKDLQFVQSILDPGIRNTFGDDGGVKEFFEIWKPEQPDSPLWTGLKIILSMGGTFEEYEGKRSFCAPYVFSAWERIEKNLPDADSAFTHAAIVGENVELRRSPDAAAEVVATLAYDVVKVDYEKSIRERNKETFAWVKLTTLDGKDGYVLAQHVRSPIDYRACFEKSGDRWRMTALIAGD